MKKIIITGLTERADRSVDTKYVGQIAFTDGEYAYLNTKIGGRFLHRFIYKEYKEDEDDYLKLLEDL